MFPMKDTGNIYIICVYLWIEVVVWVLNGLYLSGFMLKCSHSRVLQIVVCKFGEIFDNIANLIMNTNVQLYMAAWLLNLHVTD